MHTRSDFRWLIVGGAVLTVHAGFINVCLLIEGLDTAVSYITGTLAHVGVAFAERQYEGAFFALSIGLAFIFGSFVTGMSIGTEKFKPRPAYGMVLVLESALLFASAFILANVSDQILDSPKSVYKYVYLLPTFACGMQNAMCTTFSGAVIRTTHMTGTSTDIGIILGQFTRYYLGICKENNVEMWKLKVLVPLWFGFIFGGFAGTLVIQNVGLKFYALLFPACSLGLAGLFVLVYFAAHYYYYCRDLEELEASEANINTPLLTSSQDILSLPSSLAASPLTTCATTPQNECASPRDLLRSPFDLSGQPRPRLVSPHFTSPRMQGVGTPSGFLRMSTTDMMLLPDGHQRVGHVKWDHS